MPYPVASGRKRVGPLWRDHSKHQGHPRSHDLWARQGRGRSDHRSRPIQVLSRLLSEPGLQRGGHCLQLRRRKQQSFTKAAGWKERSLKIATKYYPSNETGGHTAANIRDKCERNLRELGTDCVDIFYLHAPDRNTNFAETIEECNKLGSTRRASSSS
jgi:hypothetical protein